MHAPVMQTRAPQAPPTSHLTPTPHPALSTPPRGRHAAAGAGQRRTCRQRTTRAWPCGTSLQKMEISTVQARCSGYLKSMSSAEAGMGGKVQGLGRACSLGVPSKEGRACSLGRRQRSTAGWAPALAPLRGLARRPPAHPPAAGRAQTAWLRTAWTGRLGAPPGSQSRGRSPAPRPCSAAARRCVGGEQSREVEGALVGGSGTCLLGQAAGARRAHAPLASLQAPCTRTCPPAPVILAHQLAPLPPPPPSHLWHALASSWSNRMSSASCSIWRWISLRHRSPLILSRLVWGAGGGGGRGCLGCAWRQQSGTPLLVRPPATGLLGIQVRGAAGAAPLHAQRHNRIPQPQPQPALPPRRVLLLWAAP